MEVELLAKWPEDENKVKDVYTAAEIKQLGLDIEKEIRALERQAEYHRGVDRKGEIKKRLERAESLKKYFPIIQKAIADWFKD